jgi:uncharacterized membrane protein
MERESARNRDAWRHLVLSLSAAATVITIPLIMLVIIGLDRTLAVLVVGRAGIFLIIAAALAATVALPISLVARRARRPARVLMCVGATAIGLLGAFGLEVWDQSTRVDPMLSAD